LAGALLVQPIKLHPCHYMFNVEPVFLLLFRRVTMLFSTALNVFLPPTDRPMNAAATNPARLAAIADPKTASLDVNWRLFNLATWADLAVQADLAAQADLAVRADLDHATIRHLPPAIAVHLDG